MTDRVTRAMIEAKVQTINRMLGMPDPAWNTPNSISIGGAYGGVRVERVTTGGGSEVISKDGYGTVRQAAAFLDGMIEGMNTARNFITGGLG